MPSIGIIAKLQPERTNASQASTELQNRPLSEMRGRRLSYRPRFGSNSIFIGFDGIACVLSSPPAPPRPSASLSSPCLHARKTEVQLLILTTARILRLSAAEVNRRPSACWRPSAPPLPPALRVELDLHRLRRDSKRQRSRFHAMPKTSKNIPHRILVSMLSCRNSDFSAVSRTLAGGSPRFPWGQAPRFPRLPWGQAPRFPYQYSGRSISRRTEW